ncbi:MAG: monovalent cation/H(+) antiporter subunit G [Acidimicrobiaceae bacterium]|nr:monovalent cation/H(+) antiporter subunit G [Acidimicrobiaceae bacterium]
MHVAALTLVVAGTAVVVMACLAALAFGDFYRRLHCATAVTSLGVPLVALGLSVDSGANLTTASILLPVALLFLTSPILSAAVARTRAQAEGRVRSESPE